MAYGFLVISTCELSLRQGQTILLSLYLVFIISHRVPSVSGSRIGTEEALYLYTSGPDLTSIMPCKYGKPTGIFTKFVTEDSLRSEHVRELFIKNKDVDTAALVVSQAFNNFFVYRTKAYNTHCYKYLLSLVSVHSLCHFYQNVCLLKAVFVSFYFMPHLLFHFTLYE